MSLFKNEEALILGILVAKHFKGRIWRGTGYGGSGYQPKIPKPKEPGFSNKGDTDGIGTGRGGYFLDYNGDFGKPGYGDEKFPAATPSLAGSGGTLVHGGDGLDDGDLGYGGGKNGDSYNTSSGGGGGFYGGGSSMVSGGGGGGSSWVLSTKGLMKLNADLRRLITVGTESLYEGEWIDYGLNRYTLECPWLYGLNTHYNEDLEVYKSALDMSYNQWIKFRESLNGEGCVLISNVNDEIRFTSGGWSGLADTYKTSVIKDYETGWTAPSTGLYHIIAYGANGQDFDNILPEYRGGYGGCASGKFHILAGTTLDITLGQRGMKISRSKGEGGAGHSTATGGGGATTIYFPYNKDMTSDKKVLRRMLVAGGGGGVFEKELKNNMLEPVIAEDYGKIYVTHPYKDAPSKEDEEETVFEDLHFYVNDTSTVHVQVKWFNQEVVPNYAKSSCTIYIEDGSEGILTQTITPEGGVFVYEYQFKLNTIYEPNTPTHEVTIQANILTNFFSVIADKGVTIWVTTEPNIGAVVTNSKNKIKNTIEQMDFDDIHEIEIKHKTILSEIIEDELDIDDAFEFVMSKKDKFDKEIQDLIDEEDYIEVEKYERPNGDMSNIDEDDITDEIETVTVHLEIVSLDEIDELEDIDELTFEVKEPCLVTINVDPNKPNGTVDEPRRVVWGKSDTFKAYPESGYTTEWYKDNNYIKSGDSLTVQVWNDLIYLVKFIAPSRKVYTYKDLGYINDMMGICFDAIYNTRYGHKTEIMPTVNDLVYDVYTINENYAEMSEHDIKYDMINNQRSGHLDYIVSIHDLIYVAYAITGEYAEQTTSDVRYDGVYNDYFGHVSSVTDWLDIAGITIHTEPFIEFNNGILAIDTTSKLNYACHNMEDETVKFISSNSLIASVDSEGNITTHALGKVSISIHSEIYEITSTATFEIKESVLNEISEVINKAGSYINFDNDVEHPWTVDVDYAKSGTIGNSQTTSVSGIADKTGVLHFNYKVSSEGGYDKLLCYINGNNVWYQSGTISGTSSYNINNGDSIVFTYSKDSSVSSGADAGWINNLYIE